MRITAVSALLFLGGGYMLGILAGPAGVALAMLVAGLCRNSLLVGLAARGVGISILSRTALATVLGASAVLGAAAFDVPEAPGAVLLATLGLACVLTCLEGLGEYRSGKRRSRAGVGDLNG